MSTSSYHHSDSNDFVFLQERRPIHPFLLRSAFSEAPIPRDLTGDQEVNANTAKYPKTALTAAEMSCRRFAVPSKPYVNIFLLVSPFLSLLPAHCSAGCFTPNGTNINNFNGYPDDAIYAPCNNNETSASMCCAIGPLRGSPDNCFEDGSGLCYNKNTGTDVQFWRESCTDPTWRDPACVKLFTNSTANEDSWGDKELAQCPDGSYCEVAKDENVAKACCDAGQGLFVNIVNGRVTVDTTSADTSSTVSSASFSTVTITTTSAGAGGASVSGSGAATTLANFIPDESSNDNGLSTGAKTGISVGVVVGALAAFALLWWCVLIRKKRRRALVDDSTLNEDPKELASDQGPKELP